jgi:dienelactone hydrolase
MFTGPLTKEYPKQGTRFKPGRRRHSGRPRRYFTTQARDLTQIKISAIRCPVLIIEGDATNPLNNFHRQTVIAGLRAANKVVEMRSYAGQPHSFAFYSDRERTPQPAVALKAFEEIDSFLNQHLPTRPFGRRASGSSGVVTGG